MVSRRILVIEDDPDDVIILKDLIMSFPENVIDEPVDFELISVNTLTSGIKFAEEKQPHLIICDWHLPDGIGLDMLNKLNSNPILNTIPLIVLTGASDLRVMRQAISNGADIVLYKQELTANSLARAIETAFLRRELRLRHSIEQVRHQVFLSYSRSDTSIMQRVRETLVDKHLSVWVDATELEPGTPTWESAVGNAIRGSGCVVVLLSPDAEKSIWVGREIAMAETLGKRIFPLLVRGDEKSSIPFRLMSHQFIDTRHNTAAALERLIVSLRHHLDS